VSLELVVPAEKAGIAAQPQRRATRGNAHALRREWTALMHARRGRTRLPLERQLMKHVGEGFGMHQPVLDRDVEQLPERTRAVIPVLTRLCPQRTVQRLP